MFRLSLAAAAVLVGSAAFAQAVVTTTPAVSYPPGTIIYQDGTVVYPQQQAVVSTPQVVYQTVPVYTSSVGVGGYGYGGSPYSYGGGYGIGGVELPVPRVLPVQRPRLRVGPVHRRRLRLVRVRRGRVWRWVSSGRLRRRLRRAPWWRLRRAPRRWRRARRAPLKPNSVAGLCEAGLTGVTDPGYSERHHPISPCSGPPLAANSSTRRETAGSSTSGRGPCAASGGRR